MKVDVSKIEGYDAMSAEEKVKALEGFDIPEQNPDETETAKLKALLSKANSEAANYKRAAAEKDEALKAKMTEAEKAEAERAEREKAIQEQLDAYRTKERTASYASKLLASGYSEEVAARIAAGLPEGIPDDFFTEQKALIAGIRKDEEARALGKQPEVSSGKPPVSKEDADLLAARRAAGLPT